MQQLKPGNVALPIIVEPAWTRTQGMAHGLQQPTLTGGGRVAPLEDAQVETVEAGLALLLDEPLPPRKALFTPLDRMADLLAFTQGSIQRQSRIPVSRTYLLRRQALDGGSLPFRLTLPAPGVEAAKVALPWAVQVLNALATGHALDAGAQRDEIHEKLRKFADGNLNNFSIVMTALEMEIPVSYLGATTIVLGTGSKQRWMESSFTDATSVLGVKYAGKKHLTAQLLRAHGLPGAVNQRVDSAAAAVKAAHDYGYPVVVKPNDKEQGVGVSADLREDAGVAAAYELAVKESRDVLVERWAPGHTHRITVFNGKVIRVTRRVPGGVTGDGANTVEALLAQQQQQGMVASTRRRLGRNVLELDEEALGLLRQHGLARHDVPAAGTHVRLRRRDNVNAGGTNEAVALAEAHPHNLRLAVDATACVKLDFAGVDLIIPDIGKSWLETGALICEINAKPQMGNREPGAYQSVMRDLMPAGSRIPARLVVCHDDARQLELVVSKFCRGPTSNGFSWKGGLWVDGELVTAPFESGFQAAKGLLWRADVHDATCLMTVDEIILYGVPMDRWDMIELPDLPGKSGDAQRRLLERTRAMALPHQFRPPESAAVNRAAPAFAQAHARTAEPS